MNLELVAKFAPVVGGLCVVLAAVIAGFIALYGHWVAQKNAERLIRVQAKAKLAEMRQTWVNELRDSMATFHSYAMTPELDHANQREFYEHGTRVELFMNPGDPDFPALQNCMYEALSARSHSEKWSGNAAYVEVCQRIIKREWNVLRDELNKAGLG